MTVLDLDASETRMLELAKEIVLREQDLQVREHAVTRRRRELEAQERELGIRKEELRQRRVHFSSVVAGDPETELPEPPGATPPPSVARTATATVAHRILVLLGRESRAWTAGELFDRLERPPSIETLRTTLCKMENHGLIVRRGRGQYGALPSDSRVGPP